MIIYQYEKLAFSSIDKGIIYILGQVMCHFWLLEFIEHRENDELACYIRVYVTPELAISEAFSNELNRKTNSARKMNFL